MAVYTCKLPLFKLQLFRIIYLQVKNDIVISPGLTALSNIFNSIFLIENTYSAKSKKYLLEILLQKKLKLNVRSLF